MEITSFLSHVAQTPDPFTLKANGQPPIWSDAELHGAFARQDVEMYILSGLLESAQPEQRVRLIYQTLRMSRVGVHPEVGETLDRAAALLLRLIEADKALTVFLALRRVRANHKHTAHAIVTYLLNHPEAESLWESRRPAVADCLEHALGKNVLRACVRFASSGENAAYLRRHLLRFAQDSERAQRLLSLLAPQGDTPRTGFPETPYRHSHEAIVTRFADRPARPNTITAADRGGMASALVALYRQEPRSDLRAGFRSGLAHTVVASPKFAGRVALVLDTSASLRSYGDREYSYLAQSIAFRLVLERSVGALAVYPVGDATRTEASGAAPLPRGATDLATALLDALEGVGETTTPDLVLIVSDGYENRYEGDMARVAAALPSAGVRTPIVFCPTKFTAQDDLSLRTPAPALPTLSFWHEADFPEVLLSAFAHTEAGTECLRVHLLEKMARSEQEI